MYWFGTVVVFFRVPLTAVAMLWLVLATPHAETAPAERVPGWITQPLPLLDCLSLALSNNSAIVKSRYDIQATHGIIVQTRAVALPKLSATGQFQANDENSIEKLPLPSSIAAIAYPEQTWSAAVTLRQTIYAGGTVSAALRSAKLYRDQALLNHQAIIADTLLAVRLAYYDVLLAEQQIVVQAASIELLTKELEDTTRRFDAGTVPRFNVLRAEVELANARPKLSRAKNAHRIAKNNLVNLLGCGIPPAIWEDIPLRLTDRLAFQPFDIQLPIALAQALERRPELAALRKASALRKEDIIVANAGYKPTVQIKGGYGSRSPYYRDNLGYDISGWFAGVEASWNLFDGLQTKGKVQETEARYGKSKEEIVDVTRKIELEVRTAFSNFIQAREIYESQKKVQEQAEEALRLATARYDAGTGTQLDALGAQTALTEARTTQAQALHDYAQNRAQLERAIGAQFALDRTTK